MARFFGSQFIIVISVVCCSSLVDGAELDVKVDDDDVVVDDDDDDDDV
jgi:hypothetical protein